MQPVTEEDLVSVAYGEGTPRLRRKVLRAIDADADLKRLYEEHLQVVRVAGELSRLPLPEGTIGTPVSSEPAASFNRGIWVAAGALAAAAAVALAFLMLPSTGPGPAVAETERPAESLPAGIPSDLHLAINVIDFGIDHGTRSIRETRVAGVAAAAGNGLETGLRAVRTGWRAAAAPIANLFQPEQNEQS